MSWDATLDIRDWNYTHNCNRMISRVLEDAGYEIENPWFAALDGLDGAKGAQLLSLILDGLRSDPDTFEAMNPENGWGSYETLTARLQEMLDASREYPSAVWRAEG